jgi:pheromone shutdown-related protein TraB
MLNNITEKVEKISDDIHKLIFDDGKVLYLIGTAHVSADSVKLVEETILDIQPDTIAVELDAQRLDVIKNRKKYEETDIIQIFKSGKTLFFIAQLLMSSYQKRIAKKLGVKPGDEFKKAVDLAEELDCDLVLADRNIGITLKRLVRKISFWDKIKIFFSLLFTSKKDNDIDEKVIQDMKKSDVLLELLDEMGAEMPVIKEVMLDERDLYLAGKIQQNLGEVTVAVVGAAHVPGIIRNFRREISYEELEEIEEIPKPSLISKILPWMFPVIIVVLFIYGFIYGDSKVAGQAAIYWILINGILSALGCALALGHPLTILAGFIAAPITSLNPMIGAGMVTGLVQIFLVRPKVRDIENSGEDITHIKGWWKNLLTRSLLVSLFSSIGSAIGTFVALPIIMRLFI